MPVKCVHTRGHTLDVFVTRADTILNDVEVDLPGSISDHVLLLCKVSFDKVRANDFVKHVRSWKNVDLEALELDLGASRLCSDPTIFQSTDVAVLADLYNSSMKTLIDTHVPWVNIKGTYRAVSPWFDKQCRISR